MSLYAVLASNEAKQSEFARSLGITPTPLKHNGKVFVEMYVKANMHVTEVIMLIERYLIVQPDLDVFVLALNAAKHDTTALHGELAALLFKWFPLRRAEGSSEGPEVVNVRVIPNEVIEELLSKGWEFQARVSQIGTYLDDLRRELQIHLLSGIFENPQVPKRKPIDPDQRVVTLDKSEVEGHRKYFLEETAWGKQYAQTEKESREHFEKKKLKAGG